MEKVKMLLLRMGLTNEQADAWLISPIPALSENYGLDVSPKQLIDDGKEDIVIALIEGLHSGFVV